MVYKAFAEGDLSESRSRRAQAETAREKAEEENVEATRHLVDGLRGEADRKNREAEGLRAEATRVLQQAEAERARAKDEVKEAARTRDRVVAEAQQKAQEILDQARASTQRECTELRRQALGEIKAVMGRVENIRAATDEELEAQRIFTNVAKLKAASTSLLSETGIGLEDGADSHENPDAQQTNGAAEQLKPPEQLEPPKSELSKNGDATAGSKEQPVSSPRKNGGSKSKNGKVGRS